jgi:nucleoside-diphosphate-sugar epimerase
MIRDSILAPYCGARVLVFGATGFIGGALVRVLSESGARLTLAVRDPAGLPPTLHPGDDLEVTVCNVLERAAIMDAVRLAGPDITFNLAGYGVARGEQDESLARRINTDFPIILTHVIAQFRASRWPGAELVHAGSQLEYGMLRELREDAAARPDTPYGRSKLAGTAGVARAAQAEDVAAITARLFTLYGPGEQRTRLLSALIDAAGRGMELPMTSGTQRVDFVHIDDVVEGLLRLGLVPDREGEIVNLATGRLTSIREFALIAARLLGIPVERLRFGAIPQRTDTMQYDSVSTERLRELVGWVPGLSVEEGIRRTLERSGLTHVAD